MANRPNNLPIPTREECAALRAQIEAKDATIKRTLERMGSLQARVVELEAMVAQRDEKLRVVEEALMFYACPERCFLNADFRGLRNDLAYVAVAALAKIKEAS